MSDQQPINHEIPSPATLAGIYICMEGPEEVLVRSKTNRPPQADPNGGGSERKPLGGVNISVEDRPPERGIG